MGLYQMYVPCHMLLCECDSVLRHNCFASRCMRRNKDRVTQFKVVYCLLLEIVEFKRILGTRHRVQEK